MGAGYLDIPAALNNADAAPVKAISPKAVYDPATGDVRRCTEMGLSGGIPSSGGTASVWGEGLIWGDSLVWGEGSTVNGESTAIAIQGEN